MSKGAAIAHALTGAMQGYMRGMEIRDRKDRDKVEQTWIDEQRARQRQDDAEKDKLKTDLADAAAPRTTMQGTVTEAGGNKFLNADPAQAAAVQDTLAAEAELKGEAAPTQQAGTGVVGAMSRGNEITTGPVDTSKVNSSDARNERVMGALRSNGQVERAMTMETGMVDMQAKKLGLSKAEYEFADFETNRRLEQTLRAAPSFGAGVAKILSDTQVGSMSGRTFSDRLSPDGKMVQIVGPGAGGKEAVVAEFQNNESGMAEAIKRFMAVPLPTRISWIAESGKAELEARKVAAQEKRADAAETTAQATAQRLVAGDNKPPSGYRWKADGTQEAIPGGPGDKKATGKAMPSAAAGGLLENQRNLRRAQTALQLLAGSEVDGAAGDKNATGLKGYVPNQVLNRMDPAGVDTRAAIADLGSLVIHDRSGAAVTAAEFPRLAPFIPTEKDEPETARKKLTQFVKNYEAQIQDTTEFYQAMGYNVPTEVLKSVKPADEAAAGAAVPTVSDPAEAMKLPAGSLFKDAGGVLRRRP